MSFSVLNIERVMRRYADGYRVSPGAVHEMMTRVDLWFEVNMKEVCSIARGHGRKTLMADDVVEFFSLCRNKLFSG